MKYLPILPQLYILLYLTYVLAKNFVYHGEQIVNTFFSVRTVLFVIVNILALVYGGFFSTLGWPQFIFAALWIFSLIAETKNAKEGRKKQYSGLGALLGVIIVYAIYYWGGFWQPLLDFTP